MSYSESFMRAQELSRDDQKRRLWNKVEELELRHAIENGDIRIEDAADPIVEFFKTRI